MQLHNSAHVTSFRPAYVPQIPRPDLFILRGTDGIQEVFDRLQHGILATDTETTGLDWRYDRVGALCFAAGRTTTFFCRGALETAARWFADQVRAERPLVFHGGKFDMHMIRETFGIHIAYPVHDTLTMSRLLDQRGPPNESFWGHAYSHDLDVLAEYHVDVDARQPYRDLIDSIKSRIGKHKGPTADWLIAPIRVAGVYGGLDPWYTLRLYDQFRTRMLNWEQPHGYPSLWSLYRNERWLTLALRDMEERGVLLNRDYLHEWINGNVRELEKIRRLMHRQKCRSLKLDRDDWDDEPITNWNSNPQVRSLFWDELELNQTVGEKTNKRALLRMSHPLAALLLKHRKAAKTVSAGRALLRNAGPNAVLHAWYNQNVDTGRMSAKAGVHQFAREGGVRKGVVPREGLVLRSADYSQIEMRFAAHYSGEPTLVKGFQRKDFDTHAALARRMFGVPKGKEPSSAQRDRGKTMNFAMLYGAGIDAVTEQLIDKISAREARQSCIELGRVPSVSESPYYTLAVLLRDAVRASYPKVLELVDYEKEFAKHYGFAIDAFGYHRMLDTEDARLAFNSKLQGSAAHQAKVGMVNVYREMQLREGSLAIIMQVHDDVVYESDGDPQIDQRVLELLEDHDTFRVPIIADLKGSDKNWQDKETIKLPKRRVA